MTITASPRQTALLRADLPAAMEALAQIAGPGSQLDRSASINKAALDCIYLLSPRRSSKQPISPPAVTAARAASRAKSP